MNNKIDELTKNTASNMEHLNRQKRGGIYVDKHNN